MLSLYKEVSELLRRFIHFISPVTNISRKKIKEFDWQYCVSVLFANSVIFPQTPKPGPKACLDDTTKLIIQEMHKIYKLMEKWEPLLNDFGSYEMQVYIFIHLTRYFFRFHTFRLKRSCLA